MTFDRAGLLVLVALLFLSPPTSSQTPARKKLLFLTHATSSTQSGLGPAETAVVEYAKSSGFDVTTVKVFSRNSRQRELSLLTRDYLAHFDGLVLMTGTKLLLNTAQQPAVANFVRAGKAMVAVDCASRVGEGAESWTRAFGEGRVFYTTLSHRTDIRSRDAALRAHITGGIRWALRTP